MKKRESGLDELVYIVLCILTVGTIWLTRVVISVAIRKAIEDKA
jgi:hypothetical protein